METSVQIVGIICMTLLSIFIFFWIMPIPKMQAVGKEFRLLLKILPISQIINAFKKDKPK